jgi:hypothetical protein
MNERPYRFDFVVRDDGLVGEPPPEGRTIFEGQVVASPILEALRAALAADPRWTLVRVVSTRPEGDPEHRQHVIVCVAIDSEIDPENLRRTQLSVQSVVADLLDDASLVSVEQTLL